MSTSLFHITTAAAVERAQQVGEYAPAAFAREGFIHCSYVDQVVATANRIFAGQQGLVLLEIDRDALTARVADENLEGRSERYPHIYGPLPMAAVRAIHPLPCAPNGSFALPAGVTR